MSFGSENHNGASREEIQPFTLSDDDEKPKDQKEEENALVSRPQSKPNLVEHLEKEADLDEFERNEREILQQIENERHSRPDDEDLEVIGLDHSVNELEVINEEQEPSSEKEIPESLQNRQLISEVPQTTVETHYSSESDDYPEGFPVQATSPPAYSSNPTSTRDQSQVEVKKETNTPEQSRKTSEGLGSVVAQAGGIAAALAKTLTSAGLSYPIMSQSSDKSEVTISKVEEAEISNSNYKLSNDIKELMHYIEEFTAERVEIQPILRPFFLDYIPAVGDVDPFLKIPRPDQVDDQLGLVVLDEPASAQSDATIVDMKLRQLSNVVSKPEDAPVKKLDRADKNHQHIDNWIRDIKELRQSRPPDRVAYSRQMPDLERLMQEWPPEIDTLLQNFALPNSKLDCSLEEYADICLSIVDIPVHKNRIHALHLLFSLYSEFKNSQHFRNLNNANPNFYGEKPKTADRLEL